MKVKPLFDRVLLKKEKKELKTNSNIVLPSGVEDKSSLAFVVAVGSGQTEHKIMEMQVEVGQKVLYAKYAGSEIKIGNEDFIIIKQNDILAIIEKEQ